MNSQDQMAVYEEMRKKGWLNLAETANRSESGVYGRMYNLIPPPDGEYDDASIGITCAFGGVTAIRTGSRRCSTTISCTATR